MKKIVDICVGLIHIGNRERSGLQILEKLNQKKIKVKQWDVHSGKETLNTIEEVDVIVVNIGLVHFDYEDLLSRLFDKNIKIIINEAILTNELSGVKRRSWERHLLHKIDSSFEVIPELKVNSVEESHLDLSGFGIKQVWILAASIGGPDAIQKFLAAFTGNEEVLFILIQHMDKEFVPMMVDQFDKKSGLKVLLPLSGMKVVPATCLVCPTDEQIYFNPDGSIELSILSEVFAFSPCIDENSKKISHNIDNVNIAIFSGMSSDGVKAAKVIKQLGNKVITQTEHSCVLSTIIKGVKENTQIDFEGSPKEMANYVIRSL